MKHGSISFTGKSGERYRFESWSLETRFKPLAAVYFVTKRKNERSTFNRAQHDSIYIGQTANLADPFATHSRFDCFAKHGANCVCVHPLESEEQRIAVENDLLELHSPQCNLQERVTRLFDLDQPTK
jgi:hypothetical protein